ncbi:MAG: class I SAM-dependent DNA methyltransferase, partial [Campylobacter sp.]|nr:class I SAM-dependent DNA methyltransferase [Campylobacter sp.]
QSLAHNGILSFITSNKYCRAGYGANLRATLLESTILDYVELNGIKAFDNAIVDTSIITLAKSKPPHSHTLSYKPPRESQITPTLEGKPIAIPQASLSQDSFTFPQSELEHKIKAKIEAIGTPLKKWDISINYGIKTGYNDAFIIDSKKRDEILNNCKDKSERERTSKLIKKMLRGRDIKRYSYEWAGLWLINTHNGYQDSKGNKIPPIDIKDYPTLKAYLDTYEPNLSKRSDKGVTPYNLRNCAYLEEFEKEKIVYSEIVRNSQFYLDSDKYNPDRFYAEATSFILTGENLHYLLAILNSKCATFVFKTFYAGGGLGESGFRYKKQFLEKLPIPKIDSTNKALSDEIIKCVDKILEIKACHTEALAEVSKNTESKKDISPTAQYDKADSALDTSKLESKLDSLVYKLYNLTDDEIKIIENKE